MEVNRASFVPRYQQLKNIILSEIKSYKLKPGDKIPSESQLCKKYNISKITTGKAISELVVEDILYREQGKGTFIANLHSARSDSRNIGLYLMWLRKDMIDAEKLAFFSHNYPPDQEIIKKYVNSAIFYGITNTLMNKSYYPVLLGGEESPLGLAKLKEIHIAGVILQGADEEKYRPFVQKLKKANVPYIMMNRYSLQEDINYVEGYPAQEIYKATKYLLKLGHRRIAGIGFKSKRLCYNNFFYGFQKALREENMYDPSLVKKVRNNTEEELSNTVSRLFKHTNPPTAIFLFWEPATANLISALEKHRIKIPEDVSLLAVGCEQYVKKGLKITTIGGNSPIKSGEILANKLIDLIEGKIQPPVNIKMKLKLLEGNSCRKINGAEG